MDYHIRDLSREYPPCSMGLQTQTHLLSTFIFRYLIFYSPFDIVYKLAKFFPFKLVLSVMKEVQRAHKVHSGVLHAAKVYPNAYLIMIIIGTAKGEHSLVCTSMLLSTPFALFQVLEAE